MRPAEQPLCAAIPLRLRTVGHFNNFIDVHPKRFVANLWTECEAHRSEALITNGKEPFSNPKRNEDG